MIIEQVLDWYRHETDGMESDLCSILSSHGIVKTAGDSTSIWMDDAW